MKPRKNLPSGPRRRAWCGFSSIAASAGESDSALKAESSTEIAIVSANCWYIRPVRPPRNATGMNTAERMSAMPMTGADTSFIAWMRRVLRCHAVLDVVHHRLDDDDRVVDDDADGEHEAEHRQRVDREAEQREEDERADQRDRHGRAAG